MQANVGSADRVIRIIIALVLFSLYFLLDGGLRYLSVIGFIPLITSLVSWCPLYSLLGISTCPINKTAN
ncbi:MAG: DUF2892 domain-containing protein [Calditrichaeota bacterium]|nr:MAG: DUF2892 domain-containing protein [Calditrichota bacterium]